MSGGDDRPRGGFSTPRSRSRKRRPTKRECGARHPQVEVRPRREHRIRQGMNRPAGAEPTLLFSALNRTPRASWSLANWAPAFSTTPRSGCSRASSARRGTTQQTCTVSLVRVPAVVGLRRGFPAAGRRRFWLEDRRPRSRRRNRVGDRRGHVWPPPQASSYSSAGSCSRGTRTVWRPPQNGWGTRLTRGFDQQRVNAAGRRPGRTRTRAGSTDVRV